ncbi:MAG: nucleotide exchange factor GrpE [Phycisphaerae bacterium]|nr:nucleotide exchange factor GrpE [Phycisphaerae bacterium]
MTKKKKNKTDGEVDDNVETPESGSDDPIETLQTERDDLFARLQRTAADYSNYQKRVQREMAEARNFANTALITQLLSVLDDMERALEAAAENHGQDDPLFKGMQLVHDKALEVLGGFGLEIIEALGQLFDPEAHSAMLQQPSEDHPPDTVVRELQRGYRLKGRTIRPAAVVVSTEPTSPDADDEEPADAGDQ